MRVAIRSASDVVTRTVQAIIEASGHTHTTSEEASLIIEDTRHPAPPEVSSGEHLLLGANAPIHPSALALILIRYARQPQHIALGEWVLDGSARTLNHVSAPMSPLALTEKESLLLTALANCAPREASRELLLHEVWGLHTDIDTHTLETHIYRLRSKLEGLQPPIPDIITVDGAYKLGA